MPSTATVTIGDGDLTAVKVLLSGIKDGFPKVVTRAINKSLSGVITDASFIIRKNLNLSAARVKQDFGTSKAKWENMTGAVYAKGKPVNLASFNTVKILAKGGFSVKMRPNASPIKFLHGWIWTRPTKRGDEAKTAFQRQMFRSPASSWRATPQNIGFLMKLPAAHRAVETLTGPRIEDEYAKPAVLQGVQTLANERFEKNLLAELNYELTKFSTV